MVHARESFCHCSRSKKRFEQEKTFDRVLGAMGTFLRYRKPSSSKAERMAFDVSAFADAEVERRVWKSMSWILGVGSA